jgi:hypothetical protein
MVSVQGGGSRFLPPVTQLVGIESELADLRRTLAQLERDKEIFVIRAEFFSLQQRNGKKSMSMANRYFQLKSIKDEVFKNKDLGKDTVKEVYSDLKIDMQTFELAYFNNCPSTQSPPFPRHK